MSQIRQEVLQFRKERAEKMKKGDTGNKDSESMTKSLKDKILVQKGEARRRDERIQD